MNKQLTLIGNSNFESDHLQQVKEFQGVFRIGNGNEGYFLEDSILVDPKRNSSAPTLYLLAFGLLLAAGLGLKLYPRKTRIEIKEGDQDPLLQDV